MRLSNYLLKTYKEISSDEASINAQYLIRGGFVDQLMAGVYTLLPLGLRVIRKIEEVIREEMHAAGASEIRMPALQPKHHREQTGRREEMDNLFKFQSFYSNIEYALGPTHEEVVTPLLDKFIESYKDLPKAVYQFQDKFRDEKRAKSGLLRGREFLMKDCYSFHTGAADLASYYEVQKKAYNRIFERLGIAETTYLTYAAGGSFSKYSHEFQTVCAAGEDTIYLDKENNIAFNDEIINDQEVRKEFELDSKELTELQTVEVGNIFKLNTKFSEAFDLTYTNEDGERELVYMGCYGIGLGRLMGTIVEAYHDDNGIIWPKPVAPFQYVLIPIGEQAEQRAEQVYQYLQDQGAELLFDDRDASPGFKLKDADLIGYPYKLVISDKTLEKGDHIVECTTRADGKTEFVPYQSLVE